MRNLIFMDRSIYYVFIAIVCLNSINSTLSNEINSFQEDGIIESEKDQDQEDKIISSENNDNVTLGDNNWLSIGWGGVNGRAFLGCCGTGTGKGIFLTSLFNINFSYMCWFNEHVGIVCRVALMGNAFIRLMEPKSCEFPSLLEPGIGIRWSYNGRGGSNRSSGVCYSGGVMISVPWISFKSKRGMFISKMKKTSKDSEDFEPVISIHTRMQGVDFQFEYFGINVGLTLLEIITPDNFSFEIKFGCLDLGILCHVFSNLKNKKMEEALRRLGTSNLFFTGVTFSKIWTFST